MKNLAAAKVIAAVYKILFLVSGSPLPFLNFILKEQMITP